MELNEQNATAGRSPNLSATLPVRSLVGWSHLLIGVVPLPLDTVAPTPPWNFKILPVRHRGITMHHRLPLALVLSMLVVSLSSQPQQAQLSLASTPISESMNLPGNVVVVVGDLVPGEAGAPQVDAAAVTRLTSQHDPDALIHVGDLQY